MWIYKDIIGRLYDLPKPLLKNFVRVSYKRRSKKTLNWLVLYGPLGPYLPLQHCWLLLASLVTVSARSLSSKSSAFTHRYTATLNHWFLPCWCLCWYHWAMLRGVLTRTICHKCKIGIFITFMAMACVLNLSNFKVCCLGCLYIPFWNLTKFLEILDCCFGCRNGHRNRIE